MIKIPHSPYINIETIGNVISCYSSQTLIRGKGVRKAETKLL